MREKISKFLFNGFLLVVLALLTACSTAKYDKDNKRVIVGRIQVSNDDKLFVNVKPSGRGIENFVRRKLFFRSDLYRGSSAGKGLVASNIKSDKVVLEGINGKSGNISFSARLPGINIGIGEKQGIYYFGHLIFVYKDKKLVDIRLKSNLKEDLRDVREQMGSDAKKLDVYDTTANTKREITKALNIIKQGNSKQ